MTESRWILIDQQIETLTWIMDLGHSCYMRVDAYGDGTGMITSTSLIEMDRLTGQQLLASIKSGKSKELEYDRARSKDTT